MEFLENTILKRKALTSKDIKKKNGVMKKAIGKTLKYKVKPITQLKCPVYKCFKEVIDDDSLLKHYDESH